MYAREAVKKTLERMTGVGVPTPADLRAAIRMRRPQTFMFTDDGKIPNNPTLPLICYRKAVRLMSIVDPAAVLEELFAQNGWEQSWRNGIYPFAHYHSAVHEVLGIARGHARVRFGGGDGKTLTLATEDVVVLPAGTGHQCLSSSQDLLVVGAYPPGGHYDECRESAEDRDRAVKSIPETPLPERDPVYGADGPLLDLWAGHR